MSKIFLFANAIGFSALSISSSIHAMEITQNEPQNRLKFDTILNKYTDQAKTTKVTNLEPFFDFVINKEKDFYQDLSLAFDRLKTGSFKDFDAVYGGNSCQLIAVFLHDVKENYKDFKSVPDDLKKVLSLLFLTSEYNTFDEHGAYAKEEKKNFEKFKSITFEKKKGNIQDRLKNIKKCAGECITHYATSSFETKSFENKNGILRVSAVDGVNHLLRYSKEKKIPVYLKLITQKEPLIYGYQFNKEGNLIGEKLEKNPDELGFVIRAHVIESFSYVTLQNDFEKLLLEEAQKDDNKKIYEKEKKKSRFFEVRHITATINPFEGV